MEQSDLYLLQSVPPYHLQAVVKARRLPYSLKGQSIDTSSEPSSMAIAEVAEYLFNPSSISDALSSLGEIEELILRELVACGGRANSRDLALYLTYAGLLNVTRGKRDTRPLHGSKPAASPSSAAIQHPGDAMRSGRSVTMHSPPQYPAPHPHGVFEQALHRLLLLGLLFWGKQTNFVGRDYASGVYDGVLIVPRAVMEAANEEWKTDEEVIVGAPLVGILSGGPGGWGGEQVTLSGEQAEQAGEGIRTLQRILYLYWSLVVALREGLPLVSSKLLSRSALRQVLDQVGTQFTTPHTVSDIHPEQIRTEADVPHLLFTRLLLMKLGLLYERRGSVYAAPADTFFALPLLERARRCYRLWLETAFWNELAYIPDVVVRPGPAPLDPAHEEVVRARQMVIERVLYVDPNIWHELTTFITRTKLYIPYLLFPRQYGSRAERYTVGSNPYGWDFRLRRGWLTHREGWHQVEGGFIRAIVTGPLRWLGLVEVNVEDHPDAFRLAPVLSLVTRDLPLKNAEPSWGRLIVQPNFELVALAPVSEALLVNLDRFAERVRLEHIAQYRLTRASVTRAIQVGLHTGTIQQILEQASGAEIPQNVRYSLIEWERQARRIELWRGVTLLEVDDPALLDALVADEEIRPLLGRRLTPLLIEVASDQLSQVQAILWQRDYLPALVSAPAHESLLESGRLPTHEPQWQLQENGLVQPCHAVLDLYLAAELEHITELDEPTGWRKITPLTIQQARRAGIPLEHILRFLQNYCQGGVSPSFLIRLKLWGGGYTEQNTIHVEHAPLLKLSAQALQDIRADEELGMLLGTEVAQENRLVRVAPEVLERVVELLRERGFEVE